MECYFDNSATTQPLTEVVDAMVYALTENYGNPSSLHIKGDEAKKALDNARTKIAKALSANSNEIYFTSGGTESNNIAIFGTANALKRRGNRIVTTDIEHPSVSEPIKALEEQGFEVVRLHADENGIVSEADINAAVNDKTILVSIMLVNNEVGSIQPVDAAVKAVKRANAPAQVHCDAVQAFGKMPINVRQLGVDLISVSAHKVHGPKGQGALYVKKGTRLAPHILGGGQEDNVRSGTHAMPGILGLAAAVEFMGAPSASYEYVAELRDELLHNLEGMDNLFINSPENALPYILNISLVGIPSEVLRNYLSDRGVYVSTGSACSKGHRSKVLTGMNLDPKRIDSAVRISFSRFNTKEEIQYLAKCLKDANEMLRKR